MPVARGPLGMWRREVTYVASATLFANLSAAQIHVNVIRRTGWRIVAAGGVAERTGKGCEHDVSVRFDGDFPCVGVVIRPGVDARTGPSATASDVSATVVWVMK